MEKHVKTFHANTHGRDFVVGDIHGCYDELMTELRKVEFDKEKDRLFSVGDLVDRGPKSLECIKLILEPWFFAVKGNHEILWYFSNADKNDIQMQYIFLQNGGELVPDHELTSELINAVADLPYVIELNHASGKKIGIVHAELPPNETHWGRFCKKIRNHMNPDLDAKKFFGPVASLIWGRDRIDKYKRQSDKKRIYPKIEGIDRIYVGHTIVKKVYEFDEFVYLDGGAYLPYWVSEKKLQKMRDNKKIKNPKLNLIEIT